jgi:hypothetical protein
MGFSSGIAKAGTWALDKLGLDWATGGAVSVLGVDSSVISIFLNVPDYHQDFSPTPDRSHGGTIVLNVPNHSKEFGKIAKNMAQATLNQIELIVSLQTIISEKGGITIKDQLDPYHYQVITEALEENGDEIPVQPATEATIFSQLGGAIVSTGALSALGTAADGMEAAGYGLPFLQFTNQVAPYPAGLPIIPAGSPIDGISGTITGAWPDYTFALSIINSCTSIQSSLNQYAVSLFRNAIDTEAGAILLKNGMAEFSQAISENARTRADPSKPRKEFVEPEAPGGFL